MEFAIFVWVASVIGKLAGLLNIFGMGTLVFTFFAWLWYALDGKKFLPKKRFVIPGIVALVVASSLPSEKTMYVMAGAWAGQKMVESEAAEKVVKIINLKLDEYLQEAEKELNK